MIAFSVESLVSCDVCRVMQLTIYLTSVEMCQNSSKPFYYGKVMVCLLSIF